MKQTVVLYPGGGVGVGHVVPMTELAKAFLRLGYDVTIVLIERPIKSSDSDSAAAVVERIAASNPSISFHVLPPLPAPDFANSGKHPFALMQELLRQYNELLETFLRSIVPRQRLHSLVIDMLCVAAIDAGAKVGVPVYTFFASAASTLSVLTQLPTVLAQRQASLKELGDTPLDFLGTPPLPASHFIKEMVELPPEDEMCKAMMDVWRRNTDTMGVLVNTFEYLESRAVQAFRDPLCVPGRGRALPPIYCVGPLISKGSNDDDRAERDECLAWLDAQPEQSVVFLCFGSKGGLSEDQLAEVAIGLERSGQRFLWIVRAPTSNDGPTRFLEQRPEPDLDALLPEGFLERTKGRGLVVKSWAPQVDVLRHPSTAAFVTHCGWNSTLEGVTAGVPMLCWPLAAEQKMNKVFMTDMGVAVELEGYTSGFIKADELDAKVRMVMETQEGRELRARAAVMKKEAEAALEVGGSSEAAFAHFLSDVDGLGKHLGE